MFSPDKRGKEPFKKPAYHITREERVGGEEKQRKKTIKVNHLEDIAAEREGVLRKQLLVGGEKLGKGGRRKENEAKQRRRAHKGGE